MVFTISLLGAQNKSDKGEYNLATSPGLFTLAEGELVAILASSGEQFFEKNQHFSSNVIAKQ